MAALKLVYLHLAEAKSPVFMKILSIPHTTNGEVFYFKGIEYEGWFKLWIFFYDMAQYCV